jgi:hypothetical protein
MIPAYVSFAINPGAIHTDMLRLALDPAVEALAPGRAERLWASNAPIEGSVSLCLNLAAGGRRFTFRSYHQRY